MWTLKRFLTPYKSAAIIAPLLMVLEVTMDLLQPKLMSSIVDDGVLAGNLPHIVTTGLIMLLVALIGWVGGAGCTLYSSKAAVGYGTDLRQELFDYIQTFSFRNLDTFQEGSLITRLTSDITQMQTFVQMLLRMFIRSPMLIIGSIIMAFTISVKLALILILTVPVLFIILFILIKASYPLFASVQSKLDQVNAVLQENLAGIRVVKAFARARLEKKRFKQSNEDYTTTAVKAWRIVTLNAPVLSLMLNATIVAVLWFGGFQVVGGDIAAGDLIAFINYVTVVLSSLTSIGMMMMSFSRAKVSAARINEVLHTQPDIQSGTDNSGNVQSTPSARDQNSYQTSSLSSRTDGQVEFRDVSFRYDGDHALTGINLIARPGEKVALIGSTGSGKTSLVQLIPRLYDASQGEVLVNGVNVRNWDLQDLRSCVSIVLQESILFSGSIRDNICFGRPGATDAELRAAAQAAAADDFIMKLKDGYDTELGQRGVNLSGGQKQRISIARALLMRPEVLILDDSTSAVDLRTEASIQKALQTLMKDSTTFLIAQRISSVKDADCIYVIDEGQIVARGTHDDLMAHSSHYQAIYYSQQRKEDVQFG
ncbi:MULTISPECIES: ABC transporter ATP-binding protein [unclassified Paenibacillus]|uniref:ABC transporter ATP-binding protein n=1 Tax=unclassified Paenibacillus TaxID=185978 RepID=UPI000CFD62EA|nr:MULTISPECIES: ABC transporter ATP-binding protein [unclassified Paenibacillus]PRA02717.1 multidrug ABC transporter ATP-binding protein [Paenibacillus sp. MYb63]PRA45523.1 multidrug ABC transporter ATP-binding protein [Paenibacillus sp. MYb67]